jgi:hypothetical protein
VKFSLGIEGACFITMRQFVLAGLPTTTTYVANSLKSNYSIKKIIKKRKCLDVLLSDFIQNFALLRENLCVLGN